LRAEKSTGAQHSDEKIAGKIPVEMLEPLKMAQMAETSFFRT
jgi:hypothetical protein